MDNIAIIGMGSLYPDYVNNENFWDKIMGGEVFTAPFNFKGRTIERGRMPRENAKSFFSKYFSDEEYAEMDNLGDLFKWTNYIIKEALKGSGYLEKTPKLQRTGVVLGHFGVPAYEYQPIFGDIIKVIPERSVQLVLGREDFRFDYSASEHYDPRGLLLDTEVASYAAEKFSLGGPVLNINSACSSVVYSMKIAIMYLLQGKADMMLAGATCYNQMEDSGTEMLSLLGIATEPGDCRPFDRNSKGTTGGSGAGVFMLKRLEDAIRDDDYVLGIIESIGWSNDGGDAAILAPASTGQVMAYEDAYKEGLSPDVDYIECHATGTMAGDWVEIDSISKFFRKKGINPYLGALKGNTSHFFTASTHAAIAKTILAMKKGVIPQTIRIDNPLDSRVLAENTQWRQKGEIKRAAVNSFGFGGANSHVVLREFDKSYEAKNKEPRKRAKPQDKMAVIGLGTFIGEMESTQEYFGSMLEHRQVVKELDKLRWNFVHNDQETLKAFYTASIPRGTYIYAFEFDYLKYKFPVLGDEHLLRKDFLLLRTAEEALNDAGITKGSNPDTAVLINCRMDYSELNFSETLTLYDDLEKSVRTSWPELTDQQVMEIMKILQEKQDIRETTNSVTGMMPNIKASRIAAQWGFHGPAFALTANETGFAKSLELAQYMLTEDIVSAVVLGVIELTGGMENLVAQEILGNLDDLLEYGLAEGAVVVVLKKVEEAVQNNDYIYSVVDGVAVSQISDGGDVYSRLDSSLVKVVGLGSVGEKEIGYIETPQVIPSDVKKAYGDILEKKLGKYINSKNLICDSVQNYLGIGFGLTAAAAFVKNVIQISGGIKFKETEKKEFLWRGKRTALVNSFDPDGTGAHIILSGYDGVNQSFSKMKSDKFILPVFASAKEEMTAKLEVLLKGSQKLEPLFNKAWEDFAKRANDDKVLCLIASDRASLKSEIKNALSRVSEFFEDKFMWESADGSFLTSNPLGKNTEIVCMCPSGDLVDKAAFFEMLSRFPDLREDYLTFINSEDVCGEETTLDSIIQLGTVKAGISILTQKLQLRPSAFVRAGRVYSDDIALTEDLMSAAAERADFSAEYTQDLSENKLQIPLCPTEYKPEEHYLRLLAKLISCGVFDADIFDIYSFDIHDKPGFVKTVNMGMRNYIEAVVSTAPENWGRVMRLAPPEKAVYEDVQAAKDTEPEKVRPVPSKLEEKPLIQENVTTLSELEMDKTSILAVIKQAAENRAKAYGLYLDSEKTVLDSMYRQVFSGGAIDIGQPEEEKPGEKKYLWDLDDIIEMTRNSMSNVLGPQYKNVDKYPVRARLPLPPFLFIDRITKINAEYGKMVKNSSIEIEYDITKDCILMIGDHVSFIALTESAQIGIFLMAYIGIDDLSDGTLRFRVVDSNVTIHDRMPVLGETFRGSYEITSIFKAGQTTLVTASYKGYVGDTHMLSISTIGGFFTDEDLESTKGVIDIPGKNDIHTGIPENAQRFEYSNPKTSYNDTEIKAFYTGDYEKYIPEIDPELHEKIKELPALTPKIQLIDRILSINNTGGKYGLGEIIAEYDIKEDHWAFDVHFLGDPVFPASLMMEGVNQLGILCLIHSGKISRARPGRSYPLKNKLIKSSFRGQVRKVNSTVTYKITIKEISDTAERFYFVYDVDVYWDGVNVVRTENASICLD